MEYEHNTCRSSREMSPEPRRQKKPANIDISTFDWRLCARINLINHLTNRTSPSNRRRNPPPRQEFEHQQNKSEEEDSTHPKMEACGAFRATLARMAGGHMKYRTLGRDSSHRNALLRNLVTSLVKQESIQTTYAKAKEAQRLAERLITFAKRNNETARREVQAILYVRPHTSHVLQ